MLLTMSCATTDDNIVAVFYEKGCHECGNNEKELPYVCGFECTHEEEEQDVNDCYHEIQVRNRFCKSCWIDFETCGCGCGMKMCEECAAVDLCHQCCAPLCSEFSVCMCPSKK
jgi:hypothetical protein